MKRNEDPSARQPPYPRDPFGRFRPGKGRVICTYFLMTGRMNLRLWKLDVRFAKRLSPAVTRGYHFWAIPVVLFMRKHKWVEPPILALATWRAKEVAYQMGATARGSYRGKLVRLMGEPLCWIIGQFVQNGDWSSLYAPEFKQVAT